MGILIIFIAFVSVAAFLAVLGMGFMGLRSSLEPRDDSS
jgi:archaellin